MDFNQRKRILEDNINDNAKRMKDHVGLFPDGSAKVNDHNYRKHKEGSPEKFR